MKKIPKLSKSQRGDTLIEIAFALVIIGFIVAVAIHGAIKAHQAAVTARKRTQATFIAQSQLEMMQALRNYYLGTHLVGVTPVSNGGWDNATGDSSVVEELQALGMSIDTAAGCTATATSEFFAYPLPNFTLPSPKTIVLQNGRINSTTAASGSGGLGELGTLKLSDALQVGHLDETGSEFTINQLYDRAYQGFEVFNIARLTQCHTAGYGINDITITSTVTWNDTNNKTQTVVQENRLTNN